MHILMDQLCQLLKWNTTVITEKTHLDFQNISESGERLNIAMNNLLILPTTVYLLTFSHKLVRKSFRGQEQFSLFC